MHTERLPPVEDLPVDEHGHNVQRMFDRIAHGYDRANAWMSLGIHRKWREKAVETLLPPDAGPRPRVLDLCAGTLDSTLAIARQFPQAHIVAGDFSPEMLARGAAKLDAKTKERVHVQAMDAHDLPFEDQSFDAIFCAFGVRNVSDLVRATREQVRCLRPGGVLTVLEFFRPQRNLSRFFHAAYNRTLLPVIGWIATGDVEAYRYLPRSISQFDRLETYEELLTSHGFDSVKSEPLTGGVAFVVRARLGREGRR